MREEDIGAYDNAYYDGADTRRDSAFWWHAGDVRSRDNFIDQFKRYVDLTPSEFRRRFFTAIDESIEG